MKPCPHCGIPDRTRWQVACAWRAPLDVIDAHPPCGAESIERTHEASERTARREMGVTAALLVVYALIMYGIYLFMR